MRSRPSGTALSFSLALAIMLCRRFCSCNSCSFNPYKYLSSFLSYFLSIGNINNAFLYWNCFLVDHELIQNKLLSRISHIFFCWIWLKLETNRIEVNQFTARLLTQVQDIGNAVMEIPQDHWLTLEITWFEANTSPCNNWPIWGIAGFAVKLLTVAGWLI